MNLLQYLKQNNLKKIILWFFIYTILTFIIGMFCKILVAWHVDDVKGRLTNTYEMFNTASKLGSDNVILTLPNGSALTEGDIKSFQYFIVHSKDISAGDGNAEVWFASYRHLIGDENQLKLKALQALMAQTQGNLDLNVLQTLNAQQLVSFEPLSNFQSDLIKDVSYVQKMITETKLIFWLQIGLIFLTLVAYPFGIYKLWQMKHKESVVYSAKIHKRMVVEYIVFLVLFIIIDAYAIYLLIMENVPMNFWNTFSVVSIAIPTTFAIGSLVFLHYQKKHVVDQENLKWKLNFRK